MKDILVNARVKSPHQQRRRKVRGGDLVVVTDTRVANGTGVATGKGVTEIGGVLEVLIRTLAAAPVSAAMTGR